MNKIFKTSYTKRGVNNQKGAKICATIEGNLSVKNAPKFFAKYFRDNICKIKQIQNILVTLRTFLNKLKAF